MEQWNHSFRQSPNNDEVSENLQSPKCQWCEIKPSQAGLKESGNKLKPLHNYFNLLLYQYLPETSIIWYNNYGTQYCNTKLICWWWKSNLFSFSERHGNTFKPFLRRRDNLHTYNLIASLTENNQTKIIILQTYYLYDVLR